MAHIVETLQAGQTVFGFAHGMFGEEYDRLVNTYGRTHITVAIVDTNILINDVKHSLLVKPLTSLMEAARIGALKLFASTTVRDEVWEKLGDEAIARKLKVDPVEALERWVQHYLPWITFLDPTGLPLLSTRVKDIEDPDDVPTAQIIELLRPDVVLCYDTKHLGHFDVTAEGWVYVALAYRDISRREGMVVGIELVGTFSLNTTFGFAQLSLSIAGKIDKKVWLIVGLIIIVALCCALAHPTSRRWLQTKGEEVASVMKHTTEHIGAGVARITETMTTVERAAGDARRQLSLRPERAVTPPRKVREYAAWVLARASGPLSAGEIVKRMKEAGYYTASEYPERYLKRILRAHPGLFSNEGVRWSLGCQER